MNSSQDAFISYGRADSKAFAAQLNDRLLAENLNIWFDFDDIPLGVDYQNEIDEGIARANNFLFLISPHSVNSIYCLKEVELAIAYGKRIIPLLHVEQISREIWQQRNLTGVDADWEAYQAQGKHSSFTNMHPTISKINWVYFREGVDDFDKAFAGLLEIGNRDREYVDQHTTLLIKALAWQRQQKQSRHLLVGEERKRAETWLKVRFKNEQPPCLPTDLHCEFITESIKNGDNLMTHVFLAHAEEDHDISEQVRHSLMRESFTVWTNKRDIQTGEAFQAAINRGVEEADNVVCLLSPHSLQSAYCLQEIDYALSLNKRLIPLLLQAVDPDQMPPELRSLQYIDLTDNILETDYQQDESQLLKALCQDAAYHENYKLLLAKALKWERQHRNPCLLLRGYNLRHSEAWIKVAQTREQYQPIPLIEEFIEESLRQPPGVTLDVFLSYSRKDSEFARKLNDALQIQGKTTWFDQESIAAGSADFQREIYDGIEVSNNFLFIISPNSIDSPYCAGEVEYAVQMNKRIITVLYQPITSVMPPGLASVQWLDFSQYHQTFDATFSSLLRTLDTDPDYLRTHTRLLVQALEWQDHNLDESLLLRGSSLKTIQEWLLSDPKKSPQPTRLQRDYVTASNAHEIQRQRSTLRLQRFGLGAISMVSLAAIALGLFAFRESDKFNRLRLESQKGYVLAQTRTSEALFQSDRPFEALLGAMSAGIDAQQFGLTTNSDLKAQVVTALQQAVFWVQESQRLGKHEGIIWAVSVSPNGKMVASASADGTVKLWHLDGALIKQFKNPEGEPYLAVGFTPDSQQLIVGGSSRNGIKGKAEVIQIGTWKQTSLGNHDAPVVSVAVSPNGKTIATSSEDGLIRLFDLTGKRRKTLAGHDAPVRSVTFSPDGQLLASAGDDRTIRLWRPDGTPIKTLVGHTAQVRSVQFSPNSKLLLSSSWDETVRLWNREGEPVREIAGHDALVHDAAFSPDGKTLASAGWDKTIKLWTLEGTLITTLKGHSAQIRSLSFSPDGLLASAGGDRTVRLWRLSRPLLATLQDHWARVYSVTFSPDGQLLASGGADTVVRLWNRQGKPLRQLKGHAGVVWTVQFSPDGKTLASASSDRTVKLWSRAGKLLKTLSGHAGSVYSVSFSPNGQFLASTGADLTVRLWRRDGTPIRTLQNFKKGLLSVSISPDSRTLATSGWDNQVQLWTLDGKLLKTLEGHQGWVYSVNFRQDGKQLLTASYDNTAKLWTDQGKLIATLKGHEDGLIAAIFSPDNRFIATASHDSTVKIWQGDGTLVTTLRGHRDRVSDVAFSPDGQLIATASEDKTILLWEFAIQGELDKLLEKGCVWTKDYLHTHTISYPKLRQFCTVKPNQRKVAIEE